MRRATILILLLSVAACTGNKLGYVKKSYEFSPDTEKGIVFLSTSFRTEPSDLKCGPKFTFDTLWFGRADGSGMRDTFVLNGSLLKPNFDDPRGYLINRELREGEYEIQDLRYGRYESMIPLDVRFRVFAGKVNYLGHINVAVTDECLKFDISVEDRRDRDVALFVREMENFGPESIDYQILKW